jgi:hypothetical protein
MGMIVYWSSEFKSTIDDEYALAGQQDPKILITTSRDPSSRLVQFVKVVSPPWLCGILSSSLLNDHMEVTKEHGLYLRFYL